MELKVNINCGLEEIRLNLHYYFNNTPKSSNPVVKSVVNRILSSRALIKVIFMPSVFGPSLFGNNKTRILNNIPIINPICATVARRTKIMPSV